MKSLARFIASKSLLREGSVRTIFRGPARGLKYRIYALYGLAPLYGGWEPEAQELMARHVREGDVAYDVGANYSRVCMP